jgi:hypothetical protein
MMGMPRLAGSCIMMTLFVLSLLSLLLMPLQVPLAKLKDSFNDGTSIAYLEELEQRYKADPSSVDRTWGMFFKALGKTAINKQVVDISGSYCMVA